MKLQYLVRAVSLVLVVSCGGGGDDGTGPGGNQNQTLASIRLVINTFSLNAGQTATLAPQALDASGAVIANVTGYTFSSSTASVAETRGDGTILAVGAGSATITVALSRDGVTANATASVTVAGALPTGASVTAGTDNRFTPQTVVVARNASVTFSFAAVVHNVTYASAAGAPSNIPNTSNSSVSRTFPSAGDFSYECTIHAGMTGTVVVR